MYRMNYFNLKDLLQDRNINVDDDCSYAELNSIILSNIKRILYQNNLEHLNILEIGFNNGIYTDFFLKYTSDKSNVVTFDNSNMWLVNSYVKNFLDKIYPSRHTLIIGNMNNTLNSFHELCKLKRFDLILINEKCEYNELKDIFDNIERFCKSETIIILNNVCKKEINKRYYTEAPTQIWDDLISEGRILQLGKYESVEESEIKGCGCVWGKFITEINV